LLARLPSNAGAPPRRRTADRFCAPCFLLLWCVVPSAWQGWVGGWRGCVWPGAQTLRTAQPSLRSTRRRLGLGSNESVVCVAGVVGLTASPRLCGASSPLADPRVPAPPACRHRPVPQQVRRHSAWQHPHQRPVWGGLHGGSHHAQLHGVGAPPRARTCDLPCAQRPAAARSPPRPRPLPRAAAGRSGRARAPTPTPNRPGARPSRAHLSTAAHLQPGPVPFLPQRHRRLRRPLRRRAARGVRVGERRVQGRGRGLRGPPQRRLEGGARQGPDGRPRQAACAAAAQGAGRGAGAAQGAEHARAAGRSGAAPPGNSCSSRRARVTGRPRSARRRGPGPHRAAWPVLPRRPRPQRAAPRCPNARPAPVKGLVRIYVSQLDGSKQDLNLSASWEVKSWSDKVRGGGAPTGCILPHTPPVPPRDTLLERRRSTSAGRAAGFLRRSALPRPVSNPGSQCCCSSVGTEAPHQPCPGRNPDLTLPQRTPSCPCHLPLFPNRFSTTWPPPSQPPTTYPATAGRTHTPRCATSPASTVRAAD
jgi:hypothetical protein